LAPLIIWSLLAGGGSASLVTFVMRCRKHCAVAQVWSGFAELKAALQVEKCNSRVACREAEQIGRSEAFEEFLACFWIEQRHYRRQHRGLFRNRYCLVVAERPCFRNIPLTSWTEYELKLVA
jgi:hypothetical protein